MPILFAIVVTDLIGFGIVIPLLPFYGEHFGASPLVVTLLMATYSLFQLFGAPFWGRLSDRHGRRPILLVSLAGSVAGYLWLGAADALWMLFAARALQGACAGNIAAAQAYVADVTTPENRAKGMGMIGAAFGIGFIIGPALGGALAGSDPAAPDVAAGAFLGAGLSALAFLGTLLFLKESLPESLRGTRRDGRLVAMSRVLRRPALRFLLILFFAIVFAFAGMEATFALWAMRQFGWGAAQVGYLMTYVGICSALMQGVLIGRLAKRFGEERLLVAGIAAITLGLAAIPLSSGLALLIVASGLLAIGMGMTQPAINSLISRRAAASEQGEVMGVAQSFGSLARIVGPAFAGLLFSGFGRNAPYYAGAALMTLIFVVALRLLHPDLPSLASQTRRAP
ncbi:MAG TPA: MFS transporter [Stellaceae bacterium]|nr:MFS transporter [Stellaceae bacterium]